jgi:hypothetical protein
MNGDNPIQFAEAMMTVMRSYFEKDGHLDPVAFVLATKDYKTNAALPEPEPLIIPLHFRNQKDKDDAADLIREVARRTDAVGVLCAFETWILKGEDSEKLKRAARNGLKDHPDRTEVIFVMMEHHRGDFVWVCDIKRNDEGEASLGQFKLEDGMNLGGRFANLLPQTKREFDA